MPPTPTQVTANDPPQTAEPKPDNILNPGRAPSTTLPTKPQVVDDVSRKTPVFDDPLDLEPLFAAQAEYAKEESSQISEEMWFGKIGKKKKKKKVSYIKEIRASRRTSLPGNTRKVDYFVVAKKPRPEVPASTPKAQPKIQRLRHEPEDLTPYQINPDGHKSEIPAFIIPVNPLSRFQADNPRNITPEQEMSYAVSEHTLLIGKKRTVRGLEITHPVTPREVVTYRNPNCLAQKGQHIAILIKSPVDTSIEAPSAPPVKEMTILGFAWEKWCEFLAAYNVCERVQSLLCTASRDSQDPAALGEEWVTVSEAVQTSEHVGNPQLAHSAGSQAANPRLRFAPKGSVRRKITRKVKAVTNHTYSNLKVFGREGSMAAAVKAEKVCSQTRRLSQQVVDHLHDLKTHLVPASGVSRGIKIPSLPKRRESIDMCGSPPRCPATADEMSAYVGSPLADIGCPGSPVDIQSLVEKMQGLETVYIEDEVDFFIDNHGAGESTPVARSLTRSRTSVSRIWEQLRRPRNANSQNRSGVAGSESSTEDLCENNGDDELEPEHESEHESEHELDPTIDQGNTADFLTMPRSSNSFLRPFALAKRSTSLLLRRVDPVEEPELQKSSDEEDSPGLGNGLKELKLVSKISPKDKRFHEVSLFRNLQISLGNAGDSDLERSQSLVRMRRLPRARVPTSGRSDNHSDSEVYL